MNVMAKIEPQVRTALSSDEEEVMTMCRMLHDENGVLSFSEDKVRDALRRAFNREGGILGVIGAPGHIEAMICMLIGQLWSSDDWHLEERFNYVRPEYRRSNNAKALMHFAKRCASELGIPLMIGVLSNDRTEQKVRLYEREFGKPSGAFFVHNTKWNAPLASANTSATAS
jgi:GNAT superfamily N-acetyltransferase